MLPPGPEVGGQRWHAGHPCTSGGGDGEPCTHHGWVGRGSMHTLLTGGRVARGSMDLAMVGGRGAMQSLTVRGGRVMYTLTVAGEGGP